MGLAALVAVAGVVMLSRRIKKNHFPSDGFHLLFLTGTCVLVSFATIAMIAALLLNDFSVSYVASVGSRETPRWIAAVSLWSSLEGSILFWAWVLSLFGAIAGAIHSDRDPRFMSFVTITLLATQLFFALLLLFPANPFLPVSPVPEDGPGPNPLLQNHWLMVLHPPFLYIGYIGLTIPFAFALAALCCREISEWAINALRRWGLFTWSMLTMAITLGAWWSYAVLGWGGYWAWDPVENASFMPWLAATALLHSIMIQRKRGRAVRWNLFLCILSFLLTLVGTFLTRSGILESVHSFTESHIGPFLLFFIGLVMVASFGLLLWRGHDVTLANENQPSVRNFLSREALLLMNNLLLLTLCLTVFLGTFFPLIKEAITGVRISVGEPYFNQMTIPIVILLLLLMGIGWHIPWNGESKKDFFRRMRYPVLIAVLGTAGAIALNIHHLWLLAAIFSAIFAAIITLQCARPPGAVLTHLGMIVVICAVGISKTYETAKEYSLVPGQSVHLDERQLTLVHVLGNTKPHRFEVTAVVEMNRNGKRIVVMEPKLNFYPSSRQPIASPAVHSTIAGDVYLTLINFNEAGESAALRVQTTPAVSWIWIGGSIMMAGGLLQTFRRKKKKVAS